MNFSEVEQVVAKLRQDLAAGRLTEEQFKARLRELMVEDEQGNWWMVGYETGGWYRHDGTDWVRADPPGRVVPKPVPSPEAQQASPPGRVIPKAAPSPEAQQASILAVASVGVSTLGICVFPIIITSIIGIILGGMARKRMRASGGTKTTAILATTGIILGWVGIVVSVLMLLYIFGGGV